MTIERYNHYGQPRLYVTDGGAFLVRDVLNANGKFSGVCESASYQFDGEIIWTVCREGEDFANLTPFLKPDCVR